MYETPEILRSIISTDSCLESDDGVSTSNTMGARVREEIWRLTAYPNRLNGARVRVRCSSADKSGSGLGFEGVCTYPGKTMIINTCCCYCCIQYRYERTQRRYVKRYNVLESTIYMTRPSLLSRPMLPRCPQHQLRLQLFVFRLHVDTFSRKPELILRRHARLHLGNGFAASRLFLFRIA